MPRYCGKEGNLSKIRQLKKRLVLFDMIDTWRVLIAVLVLPIDGIRGEIILTCLVEELIHSLCTAQPRHLICAGSLGDEPDHLRFIGRKRTPQVWRWLESAPFLRLFAKPETTSPLTTLIVASTSSFVTAPTTDE